VESLVIAELPHHAVVRTPLEWIMFSKDIDKELGCYCIMNKAFGTIESTANQLAIMMNAALTLEENLIESNNKLKTKERDNEGVVVQLR